MDSEQHEQHGAGEIDAAAEAVAAEVPPPPLNVESNVEAVGGEILAIDAARIPEAIESPEQPVQSDVYDPTPVIRGYIMNESDVVSPATEQDGQASMSSAHEAPAIQTEVTFVLEASAAECVTTTHQVNGCSPHGPAQVQEQSTPVSITTTTTPPAEAVAPHESIPVHEVPVRSEPTNERVSTEPVKRVDGMPPTCSLVVSAAPAVDPLAAKVRETWSLMFSSRYEDEDDDGTDNDSVRPDTVATKTARASTNTARNFTATTDKASSSLRAKLDRERRLDEQIQDSTRALSKPYRTQATSHIAPISATKTSRRRPKRAGWLEEDNPFEDVGLLPTAVRFCLEKAMLQAVECLAELHAIAQDEPMSVSGDIALGVFMTQWELNQILDDLFADPTTPASAAETTLRLHNPEYASLPLETLLRVSWFLPLDQFTRLRLSVAEISRKRLSEAKVAILNAALHRHYVLRPHPGVRMQRLLLRVVQALRPREHGKSSNQDDDGIDKDSKSSSLVTELLHALHIRIPASERDKGSAIRAFMEMNPFELAKRFELSSVVAIQRVLFFRFFIEALAGQKTGQTSGTNAWWPRSTGKPLQRKSSDAIPTPQRSTAKRKKKLQRPPADRSEEPEAASGREDGRVDGESDRAVSASSGATHDSSASVHPESTTTVSASLGPPSVDNAATFAKLNDALTAALTRLTRGNPWLVEDQELAIASLSPTGAAVRASFLAAEAFQQSLGLLSTASAYVAPSVLAKMEDFTCLITGLAAPRGEKTTPEVVDPPPAYGACDEPLAEPSKRTPQRVQRANSGSFPPPYVSTKPAYWTFEPEIPTASSPATSIPKSISRSKASPGVGDYDVRRSDKLTFQQRAGHSFSKNGLATVDEATEKKPLPTPTRRRDSMSTVRAVQGSVSSSPRDPPTYTHWVSAAMNKTTRGDEDDELDEDTIDVQVRDALRLQQSFVLDDLVQNLLHRGKSVANSRYTRPAQPRTNPLDQQSTAKTTSRVVSRVRTIATGRAAPTPPPRKRRVAEKPPPYAPEEPKLSPVRQPPRDYEPPVDDAHLQWATRVSEFYKAKLKAGTATAPVGGGGDV